jgi:hypothetical protein
MRSLICIIVLGLLSACGSSGGIYTGDVRIENEVDADFFSSYGEVVGNVTVFSESLTNFAWGELSKIDGNLFIQDSPRLENFSLSGLKEVNGAVLIKNNDKLFIFNLDKLSQINGTLGIVYNDRLPQCRAQEIVDNIGEDNITGGFNLDYNNGDDDC